MFRSLFRSVRSFFVSLFGGREATARLAVEYATLKVLEETSVSAATVLDALASVGGDAPPHRLRGELAQRLGFNELSPPERVLVTALLNRAFEASSQVSVEGDRTGRLLVVLGWVRDAAARYVE